MVQRWAVAALLRAEKKFKRVKGYREIPKLIAALGKKILTERRWLLNNMDKRVLPTSTKGRGNIWMCEMNTQFVVDESGKKTAVILPVEEYDELLEDIHDLAVIAERKDEPTISFDELKKRLKADGLI